MPDLHRTRGLAALRAIECRSIWSFYAEQVILMPEHFITVIWHIRSLGVNSRFTENWVKPRAAFGQKRTQTFVRALEALPPQSDLKVRIHSLVKNCIEA